jgi:hypothetical protein
MWIRIQILFSANPDAVPDPTFHPDADPDPDPSLKKLKPLWKSEELSIALSSSINYFVYMQDREQHRGGDKFTRRQASWGKI